MLPDLVDEARRQIEICNACRYCEGYCAVFPAMSRERTFSVADISQLANLCHNCRGCYYACQFSPPHEFALNLPKALAEVRQESWQNFAWPSGFAKAFHRSGVFIGLAFILGFAVIFWMMKLLGSNSSDGFYAVLSHSAMVAIFLPAFVLPLISLLVSVRKYWKSVDGKPLQMSHISRTFGAIVEMRNLAGGYGEGCNFEDEDRFTNMRRWSHQSVMLGFFLCFAATCVATVMHYALNLPAPYTTFSPPKLLGLPGGVLLSIGTLALVILKYQSDRNLADARVWGGEMGFIVLLFTVSTTGLLLYGLRTTSWLPELLALHLGAVLAFFLLTPYSKMVHGFYRFAALLKEAQN